MSATGQQGGASSSVLGSSAVMAAGTVVSRLSGFLRTSLLAAALGKSLHADVFNIANTLPNMLYILMAGGIFNAVLVPQLVRAMRHDPDGGEAYTSRIITLAAVFLAGVSAVLVLGAPWLMRLFLDPTYFTACLQAQRDSVIAFARYCLPQVFFYGMFVLVGQVLNARGRFGPMMWAPIANNVVSVAVLVAYLVGFGPAQGAETVGGFSSSQELLLGLGSTAGIAVQLLVLVPYLRAAGVRFSPRWDFRGSGLGHTLRLGIWTVLFVVVNQIAYTVVVRLASSGTAGTTCHGVAGAHDTGYTVYANTFLLVMVPHSVITVSLATAVLPRLSSYAAEGDLRRVGAGVSSTLRSALALVVPLLAVLALLATDVSQLIFGWGAASDSYDDFAPALALFTIGLVFFTVHYLMLRGFYALERTRQVFWIQCVIASVNIVAAVLLTRHIPPSETAPRLVLAYAASYAVGASLSFALLTRALHGLQGAVLVRMVVRLVVAVGVAALVGWAVRAGLGAVLDSHSRLVAVLRLLLVGGLFAASYVGVARLLRLDEVNEVVTMLARRLGLRTRDLDSSVGTGRR